MNLKTIRRQSAAVAAVLALSVSLAACSEDDGGGDDTASDDTSETTEETEEPEPTEEEPPATGAQDQTFGEGCAAIPTDPNDAGSFEGMVQDPVGTAAGNNPVLTTLTAAVGAVEGLGDTLNDPAGTYTVFAPYDPAFEEIPKKDLNALIEGAQADGMDSGLAGILIHHALGSNLDPASVVGEQESLAGTTLTIEGDENGMTVDDGTTKANVICGNVPTANATVYVIDKVLLGNAG